MVYDSSRHSSQVAILDGRDLDKGPNSKMKNTKEVAKY